MITTRRHRPCQSFAPALLLALAACTPEGSAPPDLAAALDGGADSAGPCDSDRDCSGATPRCYLYRRTCVACLPAPAVDNCPSGQVCKFTGDVASCTSACADITDCLQIAGPGYDCCGGACVDTSRDPKNCGACGLVCPTPTNGDPGCFSGHCPIGDDCDRYADCDHDITDGCEVDTQTDPSNCGGCGKVCKPFPNGIPECLDGICNAVCAPGYADCDGNWQNGCETDLTGDIASCGACGHACPAPAHASAACDASHCGYRCQLGFADCDADPATGCEASVEDDLANCGRCGNACPPRAHAAASTCIAGRCGVQCDPGWGDCDGDPATGCEVDLTSDAAHCGACDHACPMNQVCVSATCR